ncbi:hypothetical protein SFRURICE_017999 [Spodoptera frugiperda]|nr:hypothetical protein SFRURICE_017999 [Spodoptera frugiperda]
MDDARFEEAPIKKVTSSNDYRAPRRLDHLDEIGQNLELLGKKVGRRFDNKVGPANLDTISFESENLKTSHSESSSRRNSDDGGRAERLRADGTSSEPPTASVTNFNAWGELNSSTSTTRTELSLSDGGDEQTTNTRRRSHESALPGTPMHQRPPWKSADSLVPESAFGTSLADIMESPANKNMPFGSYDEKKVHLRDDIKSIRSDSSEEKKSRGWRFSKPDSKNSDYGKDDKKPSLPFYPNEKDENVGETNSEGLEPESLLFRDGRRRIDMVLAYEEEDYGVMTENEARKREHRRTFQENLVKEGLELELENKCLSFDEKTWFLKIHIPWKTEMRLAEVIGMKLPTRRFITISVRAWSDEKQAEKDKHWYSKWRRRWKQLFLVKDRHTQFSPAQRSLLVMQILLRAKYDNNETKMGIRRLLNDGTYTACFPLHEGRYEVNMSDGTVTDRRLLYLEWARPAKWYKKQPLWLVRRQSFMSLGRAGLQCSGVFMFVSTVDPGAQELQRYGSKEICDTKGPGNTTLCPLCDKACQYQTLSDSCLFAKLTYLFDNPATVFFAIFMSFWATTFLELWKRKQSVLRWEWDMGGVDQDEDPRPEFEASVKTFRTNPVTREKEPYLPNWQKTVKYVASSSAVLFMIYAKIAVYLTNMENPRTQTEYEDSYTFKIFFFEFMNFYSSLIYIAFFKGRFYDYPGDDQARKSEFFKLKGDICDPAGCLSELCIQLAIIMIGKQFVNNFVELGYPYGILKGITYAAVVSNAFVIAYTSDFIPRMVYKYVYSPDNTLAGYIDHSLSLFNTSDYQEDWGADENEVDPPVCAYRGYRNPPDHADPYGLSPHYWHVFAARLAFVVVFELFIPDVPSELRTQMQREALLAKEAKYEHGRRRLSTEYRQLLTQKSDGGTEKPTGGAWLRRASRASDVLDAHISVSQRPTSPRIVH